MREKSERLVGAAPIRFPDHVTCTRGRDADGDVLDLSHDGYMRVFNLMVYRKLALSSDGLQIVGTERLGGAAGLPSRLAQDAPFALHFHLHPKIQCDRVNAESARLQLANGEDWYFTAAGAQMSIEPSVHYADLAGPARSLQIVLRGASFGETTVHWRFERPAA